MAVVSGSRAGEGPRPSEPPDGSSGPAPGADPHGAGPGARTGRRPAAATVVSEVVTLCDGALFATVRSPRAARPGGPVVVFLNAGLLPRSGPYRVHAELGATLASHGIRSVAVDLPGTGDSPAGDVGPAALLSALVTAGLSPVVPFGVCAGAARALDLVAARAERPDTRGAVAGVVLFDPPCGVTPRHGRAVRWRLPLRPSTVRVALAKTRSRLRPFRRFWRAVLDALSPAPPGTGPAAGRDLADFRSTVGGAVRDGVPFLTLNSGEFPWDYSYEGQWSESMEVPRGSELVTEEHHPAADHLLRDLGVREVIYSRVTEWLVGRSGGTTAAEAA